MHHVNTLSLCDAAYLAGIIDGEGTVTLTCKNRGENRRLLLDEYVASTPRNGRYTAAQHAKRAEFERRFFAISTRARSMKSDTQKREPSGLPVIDLTG